MIQKGLFDSYDAAEGSPKTETAPKLEDILIDPSAASAPQATVAAATEEKELFEDYEAPRWRATPRLYKIFGGAALANLALIAAFGQFNLFTTRGCEAAYVGVICQAIDSAYVASTFLGDDKEWASIDYKGTKIEDAEITYIDVSEPLKYPEGYFAEYGESANLAQNAENGGFPIGDSNSPFTNLPPASSSPSNSGDLMGQPAVIPTPNDKAANQESAESPFVIGGDSPKPVARYNPPKQPKIKAPKPAKLPNESPAILPTVGENKGDKGKEKKETTPAPSPTPINPQDAEDARAEFEAKINKKPLQDLANEVIETKVDLKQNFTLVLDGVLTKDGKFDAKKTRFVKNDGQPEMVNIAKDAIQALGDSQIFSYLISLGVDRVNITLVQDDKNITALIRSNLPTEEKARTVSSGFNGLMGLAKINVKEPEVQALMGAMKFEPKGKSFLINFAMPKEDAHKLIDQKLQEARQKKSQPNSSEGAKEATGKGE